jgi:Tol biopolymer transport system component
MRTHFTYWRYLILAVLVTAGALPTAAATNLTISLQDFNLTPPVSGYGHSGIPIISPDGRHVAFASSAVNLVSDANSNAVSFPLPGRLNVFVRDRVNGTTTLASLNFAGTAGGNGDSFPSGISADARYVLFESFASDLTAANDTNNTSDVFVRDLLTQTTFLVSVGTDGNCANGVSRSPVMTPDGRFVAFTSTAANLVSGDFNRIPDVFVRDLVAGTTTLVSVGAISTNFSTFLGGSEAPEITPDGRYVVLYSTATNLVPGVRSTGEIYVRDLIGGTTTWASTNARALYQTTFGPTNVVSCNATISADGNFVAFEACTNRPVASSARGVVLRFNRSTGGTDVVHTNAYVPLIPFEKIRNLSMTPDGRFIAFVGNIGKPTGQTNAIYLWDAQTGTNTLVSHALPFGALCDSPLVSSNGQYVAFVSATNFSEPVTFHLYLRDMLAATPVKVDTGVTGPDTGADLTCDPSLSVDGRFIGFTSQGENLVAGELNHASDVFVKDMITGAMELVSVHDPFLPGGGPTLSWLVVTGQTYQVQSKTDVKDGAWENTSGSIMIIGKRGYVTYLKPSTIQKFYRVVAY